MKNIVVLILVVFSLSSCTIQKDLYLWNCKRKLSKFKFDNKDKKIYMSNKINLDNQKICLSLHSY
jgi:hypothetical protein